MGGYGVIRRAVGWVMGSSGELWGHRGAYRVIRRGWGVIGGVWGRRGVWGCQGGYGVIGRGIWGDMGS